MHDTRPRPQARGAAGSPPADADPRHGRASLDDPSASANAPATLLLAALLVLAGCAQSNQAPPAPFPSLARVPARPAPPDTPAERDQIEAGLAGDQAAARAARAQLDYNTGRTAQPPDLMDPARRVASAPDRDPAPPAGDVGIAEAYVEDTVARAKDDGELKDFMDRMARAIPDNAGAATLSELVGLADPVARPGPAPVATVAFAGGSAVLPLGAEPALARAWAAAAEARAGLRIVSRGTAGLAATRANTVGEALRAVGAPPARLSFELSGTGNETLVYLTGSRRP